LHYSFDVPAIASLLFSVTKIKISVLEDVLRFRKFIKPQNNLYQAKKI
jgi:hypothetical protein